MTLRRLPLTAAASVLVTALLFGCSAPHDMSLTESCKQWIQLHKGAWTEGVKDDLRAAAPRMHEAVAKQVLVYVESLPTDKDTSKWTDEQIDAAFASEKRLFDLCGQ